MNGFIPQQGQVIVSGGDGTLLVPGPSWIPQCDQDGDYVLLQTLKTPGLVDDQFCVAPLTGAVAFGPTGSNVSKPFFCGCYVQAYIVMSREEA